MEEKKDKVIYVPIEDILPNRFQPRLAFDEKELNELANSIIKYGVIQPIVIRSMGEKYEIIAGERRYKASVLAGLKKIPAIIMETDDNTSAEIALLENIQRKNLSVIEEAQSYKKLIDKGFTQDDIATKLGVSQSAIANKLRLLNLPKEVQDALLYNRISERHARSLLTLNNADLQKNLLNRIISERLTVKQTEDEVSMILSRKEEQKEIPQDIMKFLNPEPTVIEKEKLVGDKGVEEFLDIKVPEVVNIENEIPEPKVQEYEEDTQIINPFQTNTTALEEPTQNMSINDQNNQLMEEAILQSNPSLKDESSDNSSETLSLDNPTPEIIETHSGEIYNNFNPKPIVNEEDMEIEPKPDSLLNEFGEVDLPKVINKVRDFVRSLDEVSNLIETTELDLDDKYQITIDIKKN